MSTLHRRKEKFTQLNAKGLHPRNLHNAGYDFPALIKSHAPLAVYVKPNIHGNLSIDFADFLAVKALNTALLTHHYRIIDWDIPAGALCPPIPGRADYIHYVAELLGVGEPTLPQDAAQPNLAKSAITLLDIGTGANGIYPLLACKLYEWQCVGSDINAQSLANVAAIIAHNPSLKESFTLREQPDKNHIFHGIIQTGEFFDVSVCNPPFHASLEEAVKGSQRKLNNLARNRAEKNATHSSIKTAPSKNLSPASGLNFGGQEAELWCNGGEQLFLKKMIKESQLFATQCRWFTSLVSKNEHVKPATKLLNKIGALEVRVIEMAQGNKITRILAWTFM